MKHMWDERGFFYYRVLRTHDHPHFLHALVASLDASRVRNPCRARNETRRAGLPEPKAGNCSCMSAAEAISQSSYHVPARPLTYVLVTPARNEADFIEETLKSVTSQSVLPLKWVIVSDGSTDGTDDIVRK